MDRRTLLAISICLLIYVGWQKFYLEPRMPVPQPVASQGPSSSSTPATVSYPPRIANLSTSQKAGIPEQTLKLQTGTGEAFLTNSNTVFSDWSLKSYKLGIAKEAAAVDMQSVTQQQGELGLAFDDPAFLYLNDIKGTLVSSSQGAVWSYEDEQIRINKEIKASAQLPYVDLKINVDFKSSVPRYAFLSVTSKGHEKDPEAQDRQFVYWNNQSLERVLLKDSPTLREIPTSLKYIGVANRYFLFGLVNQNPLEPKGLIQPLTGNSARISFVYPVAGKSLSLPVRVYFGPKELNLLRQVEPTLDHTVDFGWFTVFAYPLLKILKWLYQFVNNYGIAIILLTILLKLATYPLTYKSMKSMKKMAKVQPQLQKLREKYKDDKEALNREMLSLMRTHGYNPMAGCLPMLIQMPIFFALYRVLYSSIELYNAPFALWIQDLSTRDPYYVTPVLLSITMFVQQKLTPNTATDPAQARMMQLMPLMFGAFMLALPSGLTLYMLVNAVTGIIQQMVLNKKLDATATK